MGRTLGYNDAVRTLGGDAAKLQRLVDTLVGTGMLALVGPFRDVLGWFDAKAELSRITERLITGLVENRQSLSRFERTERLHAAHVILAATAFFEIMAEAELPVDTADLVLTADEQQTLTIRAAGLPGAPVPGPAESYEDFRARLLDCYRSMAAVVMEFGNGLAIWERMDASVLDRTRVALTDLAEPAVGRFESLLGRLAAEFPEVAFWASVREQTAIHARLRDVTTALTALGEVLETIAVGRAPDARRSGLARGYSAALDRPVAETGEVPAGLRLPTLGEAFVPQSYRTAEVTGQTPLNREDWWESQPVRDNLLAFLAGRLISPDLSTAPMLVLGQPGSGKSVLARILAARLPANDFLSVLVPLRSVHAVADVQEQIEQAIRKETGERLDWPALVRSADNAIPVVILDGFDELLQATGVSQTDYLLRVAAFQRREADQGRPVAVIVTSRTSVADRAQTPEGSVAIRLEPFDRSRVGTWLDTWNRTNAEHFQRGTATALNLETAMRYPQLAGQPLLLLMLAIYDAEGGSLRSAGTLRQDELYERLLERFARREVDKRSAGLPIRERDQLVEAELRKLSVVAFSMFNRGAQWVTEDELDADLRALPGTVGPNAASTAAGGLRAPIRAAELALGSFFFVYRARATRDDDVLFAYEFLHATFGEFLVARLIHRVIRDMVARERATTFITGAANEDGLLHALLSFAPLAARRQVVAFAYWMTSDLAATDRVDWADLLVRLFDGAQQPRLPDIFDAYAPRSLTVPARVAAHTSNLLILTLCSADIVASRLVGTDDEADSQGMQTIRLWHELALLWHSQGGTSGWVGLLDLVQVDRIRRGRRRDVALSLTLDQVASAPPVDMNWVIGIDRPADEVAEDPLNWVFRESWEIVPREVHFTCDRSNDSQHHAIGPLLRAGLPVAGSHVYFPIGAKPVNILGALMNALLDPTQSTEEREALYLRTAEWTLTFIPEAKELLLRCLELDLDVGKDVVSKIVLDFLQRGLGAEDARIRLLLLRCANAHMDATSESMAQAVSLHLLERDEWTDLHLDTAIRMAELGLGRISIRDEEARRLLGAYATKRPDFIPRIRILGPD
ncbi:NACHT domain-containing protein [Paractinoplanes toevensis]|uniref:AAA+ ATPase domain-containing protein n=1 Tax=Paractinoplanes toevensis TaxID=571911 RepID=A0A919W494_9ACTN|nr:hypothetical protein [Actinoplanes toevensis]GIM89838.1 hypothetical protein Ato02nite_016310 [Actinoplanes toevensis]